jgi:PAS domain S-box-containing protein
MIAIHTAHRVRPWLAYLLAGLVITVAYFALPTAAQNLTYDIVGLSAILALLGGVRLHRPAHRLPWYLLALGDGLAVAGDLIWTYDENVRGVTTPFPSFADALYLVSYVVFFAGVLVLIRDHAGGPDRAAAIDTAIIAAGIGTLVWVILIAPPMADAGRPLLERVTAGAYPAVDILVLAAAVRLALGIKRRPFALQLLILALGITFIADIVYAILLAEGLYHTGHIVDAGWLLAYILHGTLALHPSMRARNVPPAGRAAELPSGRLLLLAIAALTGPGLLAVQLVRRVPTNVGAVVVVSVAVILLALGRVRLLAEDLRGREARFRALVQNSSDIVAVVDVAGTVRYISPALQRVLGYAPEEFTQHPLLAWIHPDDAMEARQYFARLRDHPGLAAPLELRLHDRGGAWRHFEVVGTNQLAEPGVRGLVLNCRDITARKRVEAALRETAADLAAAQRIAGLGNWGWDRDRGTVRWSDEVYRLLGLTPGESLPSYSLFLDVVHPADRDRVQHWARAIYRGHASTLEHRLLLPGGEVRVVQHQVEVIRDGSGPHGRHRLAGTVLDITERARADEVQRFLARAGEQLAGSLDFDTTLAALARLAVPDLGDWCAIDVLGEDGCVERVLVHHADPALAGATRALCGHRTGPHGIVPSLRSGHAPAQGGELADFAAAVADHPDRCAQYLALGVGAYVIAPMEARSRTLGVLTVVSADPARHYDARDLALVEDLARRSALALDNTRLHLALAARERELQDLVGRLLLEQEEERRRVAYDVHDGLAQLAASAYQHLQAYEYSYRPRPPREQQELDQALAVVRQAVQEARRVIADLRPTALDDFGLAAAVRRQVEYLRAQGWQIAYRDNLNGERFPAPLEAALYRVIQEALNNIRKHAGSTEASIVLERDAEAIRVQVRDNGVGFVPGGVRGVGEGGERIGLRGMRERVTLLGGTFSVVSEPGCGTEVLATVPVPQVSP